MTISKLKPPPAGWPRISSALFYEDAAAAIDWLVRVFGFEVRLRIEGEGGRIEHSELTLDEGLIMVGSTGGKSERDTPLRATSPRALGGAYTQALCVCIDDVDAHCDKARSLGAKILEAPKTNDYGEDYWVDRTYQVEDLEGHTWFFMQRVRDRESSAT